MSADSRRIAVVANRQLYVRPLSQPDWTEMKGVRSPLGGVDPVFSPDGEFLAFFAPIAAAAVGGTIFKIPFAGGTPIPLYTASLNVLGMSWTRDGIVFSDGGIEIKRVAPNGGRPARSPGCDETRLRSRSRSSSGWSNVAVHRCGRSSRY